MTIQVNYVLGLGRSGSTVIGRAMAEVLGAVPGDEVMAVWQRGVLEDRVCSCGVPFSLCVHWRSVVATAPSWFEPETAQRVVGEIHRVMGVLGPVRVLTPGGRASLVSSIPDFWFDAVGALYRGIASVGGSTTIVDTSKAPVLAWLLAHVPGVRVSTVLVVRDPRDVARSWSRPPALPEGAHELPALVPWKTAIVWLLCNAASERVHVALGGSSAVRTPIRLEDFTADPRRAINAMARSFGAEGFAIPDPLLIPTVSHTMSGHPSVRFAGAAVAVHETPPRPAAWRGASTAVVSLVDAPLMRRYGYRLGDRS